MCIASIPGTAENVAETYGISRQAQDTFALSNQNKAALAISNGHFADEISPVAIPQRRGDPIVFDKDEHPRETTLEKLAMLRAPFRKGSSVTAGNASGVNDGAAVLLIASEAAVKANNLTPVARILGSSSAGVSPNLMGIGPVPATRKLCERFKIDPSAFDIIELNEGVAAQCVAVLNELGIPLEHLGLNQNGGAWHWDILLE